MVGKVLRPARFDEVAKIIGSGGGFKPDPRLGKLEESTKDVPWYTDVHRLPVRRLLERYGSSIHKGLSEAQVAINRQQYGSNVICKKTPPSVKCWSLFKAMVAGLNSLIWICVVLSMVVFIIRWICFQETPLEHLIFAGILLFAIIFTTIGFRFQTIRSHRLLSPVDNFETQHALAKRNGRFSEIPTYELVVGDIVQLSYGDVIPADIRIIESHEFFVDNSGLTGESDPKRRRSVATDDNPLETKNMVYFSTHALEGYAKGVVVNVGNSTLMGRVAEVANQVNYKTKSPVRKELDKLVAILVLQAVLFGTIFFLVGLLVDGNWKEALIYVLTVIIANFPEGLALTSTILLALIASQLRALSCHVKNLHAIETLGATTCVCTDKTGTITQNRMAIAHLWFDDRIAQADTSEFLGDHDHRGFKQNDPGFKALARIARLCSRARFKSMEADKPICKREVHGDASEAAILRFMEKFGNVAKYRRKYKKLYELPFNARTKLQAFVYEIVENGQSRHYLTVKGAPEKVFQLCTSILVKDMAHEINEKWRVRFYSVLESLASIGDRIIGFADVLLPTDKYNADYNYDSDKPEFLHSRLRFVGLMSMIDPPRAAVPEAVAKCNKAGVKVVMITGDHPITATAIARATGIFPPHLTSTITRSKKEEMVVEEAEMVYTGQDLVGIEPAHLDSLVNQPGNIIFARTTPEQKHVIVESLQRLGHYVTVVGDGVNDSSAIKRSDVGIVMGVTGSEVSKEVGDMVLLDDNFGTVVQGIEEGRLGFENLGKLVRYTMSDNIAQLYCWCCSIVLRLPKPLASMAMLLTVLGTDILPAVSICFERLEKDVLKKSEFSRGRGVRNDKRSNKLITSNLISHIYTQAAVLEVVAGFFAYFATMATFGFSPARLLFVKDAWDSRAVNDLQDDIYGQEWTYVARKNLEARGKAAFFVSMVVMQVANVLTCKGGGGVAVASSLPRLLTNWRMNVAIVGELLFTALILYVPQISVATGLVPLAAREWLYTIPFAVLLVLLDVFRRWCIRHKWLSDPALASIILN